MRGDTRCIEGRLFRHHPFPDDPYYEHDVGPCPECEGFGCDEYQSIMNQMLHHDEMLEQAQRCACRGVDDYCVCQNAPDRITRLKRLRAALSKTERD
jgi:hypothetical protein